MNRFAVTLIITALLVGCTASGVMVQPSSMNIQIGNNPPGAGFAQVGPITAKHGGGCGLYGSEGNFEGAANILRNRAAKLGADYVQIIRQEGEHMSGLCLDRAYVIDGVAYKRIAQTKATSD